MGVSVLKAETVYSATITSAASKQEGGGLSKLL